MRIVCSIVLYCFLVLVPFVVLAQQNNSESIEQATTLGNQANQKWGSKEGLNQYFIKPLMSGGTPMETLDGSKQFSGMMLCPSSNVFMEVLIQPGPTGDLQTVIVHQDTNLDNDMDYVYQPPFAISGVCANGVISCDPGTWTNCRTYAWSAAANSQVTLAEVVLNDLGGCYCINRSCGSNLVFSNISVVLKDIGAGIAGAVHNSNPRYVISDVKIDGTLAQYYGQDSGRCTVAPNQGIAEYAEQFFNDPDLMMPAVTAEVSEQRTNPRSLYSVLFGASQSVQAEQRQCTVQRVAYWDWNNQYDCTLTEFIQDQCETLQNDPGCSLMQEEIDGVLTYNHYNPTGLLPLPTTVPIGDMRTASCVYSCPADFHAPCTGNPPTCTVNETSQTCVIIRPIQNATMTCGMPLSGNADGTNVLELNCATIVFYNGLTVTGGGSTGQGYAWYRNAEDSTCFGWPSNMNLCVNGVEITGISATNFPGNLGLPFVWPSSTQAVTSDGFSLRIVTWGILGDNVGSTDMRINFSPRNCPMQNTTGNLTGCYGNPPECQKNCIEDVRRDWWYKAQTYTCTAQPYDFSNIRERVRTIKSTTVDDGSSISYQDYRKSSDGSWINEQHDVDITGAYRKSLEKCEKACKTRTPVVDTQTNITNLKSDYLNNTNTYKVHYRQCSDDSVCHLEEAGEEIVKDCQCINEFTEAAMVMQMIRMAGKDIICSDGVKKQLQ